MKANELRLKNYVLDAGVLATVTCIEENRLSTNRGKLPYSFYDEIEPIPLTEEWLLKFGFSHKKNYYYPNPKDEWLVRNNLIITIITFDDKIRYEFNYQSYEPAIYLSARLDYVHQLQNLFFDLTGNELTIKT